MIEVKVDAENFSKLPRTHDAWNAWNAACGRAYLSGKESAYMEVLCMLKDNSREKVLSEIEARLEATRAVRSLHK